VTLILYGRKKLGEENKNNFNKSPYQAAWLIYVIIGFAAIALIAALYGCISGTSGE